jgi:predicted lipoprotein with Yx(FWY)xxD motif
MAGFGASRSGYVFVLLAAAATLGVSGCGSDGDTDTAPTREATVSIGTPENSTPVLVDSEGKTLYYFTEDLKNGGSACFGRCAEAWHPLVVHGEPEAGDGAREEFVSGIQRPDGALQVTYAGRPLYTLAKDQGASASAFGGSWHTIRADGASGDGTGDDAGEEPFPPPPALIAVGSPGDLGAALVDSAPKTYYYFDKDRRGSGTSACYGACARIWRPKPSGGTPTVRGGAHLSLAGSFERKDGYPQATYDGRPLYTYIREWNEQTKGVERSGFGGRFYPLRPDGRRAGD